MPEGSFPESVADIMENLTELCRAQKQLDIVELLLNSQAHFEETGYDNWDGGRTFWALRIEIPKFLYAKVSLKRAAIANDLKDKLEYLDDLYSKDQLSKVTITPLSSAGMALGQRVAPSDTEIRRIWKDGYFRLFLSHRSSH